MNNLQILENVINNNNIESNFITTRNNIANVTLFTDKDVKKVEINMFDLETGASKVSMKQILELLN
jgi:hypothetical protein